MRRTSHRQSLDNDLVAGEPADSVRSLGSMGLAVKRFLTWKSYAVRGRLPDQQAFTLRYRYLVWTEAKRSVLRIDRMPTSIKPKFYEFRNQTLAKIGAEIHNQTYGPDDE